MTVTSKHFEQEFVYNPKCKGRAGMKDIDLLKYSDGYIEVYRKLGEDKYKLINTVEATEFYDVFELYFDDVVRAPKV